jgi:hypothetical protein
MSKIKPVDLISLQLLKRYQRKLTKLKVGVKGHIDTPFADCDLNKKEQLAVWCKVRGFTIRKTANIMGLTRTPAHYHLHKAIEKISIKRKIGGLEADDLAVVLIRDIEKELY